MIVLGVSPATATINKLQNYVSTALPYTSTTSNQVVLISGTSGTFTLNTAIGNQGQVIELIHGGTSLSQVYTINTTSAQTVGGIASGTYKLVTSAERLVLISDNANWQIMAHDTSTLPVSFAGITVGTGFGTPTNNTAYWVRRGNYMRVFGSCTTGTVAASLASSTLPGSAALDSTFLSLGNTSSAGGNKVGGFADNAGASDSGSMVTATGTSTTLVYFGGIQTSSAKLVPANGSTITGNSDLVSYEYEVPISTWQP